MEDDSDYEDPFGLEKGYRGLMSKSLEELAVYHQPENGEEEEEGGNYEEEEDEDDEEEDVVPVDEDDEDEDDVMDMLQDAKDDDDDEEEDDDEEDGDDPPVSDVVRSRIRGSKMRYDANAKGDSIVATIISMPIRSEGKKKKETAKKTGDSGGGDVRYRSVKVVIVTNKDDPEAAYLQTMQNKRSAIEELEIARVPREKRSDVMLRYECEIKGIACTGIRELLLQRLKKHDAGEKVITAAQISKRITFDEVRASWDALMGNGTTGRVEIRPGEQQRYKYSGNTLKDLSHDVIRHNLLPYLTHPGDLVSMMRVCRYLHNDARAIALERSIALFGRPNATVMELSCYSHLFSLNHNTGSKFSDAVVGALSLTGENKMIGRGIRPEGETGIQLRVRIVKQAISAAIVQHGSIEGLAAKRYRRAAVADLRRGEDRFLLETAGDRIKNLNAALAKGGSAPAHIFDETYIPKPPERAQTNKRKDPLHFTIAGQFLMTLSSDATKQRRNWCAKAVDHVVRLQPKTPLPLIKKHPWNKFVGLLAKTVEEVVLHRGIENKTNTTQGKRTLRRLEIFMLVIFNFPTVDFNYSPDSLSYLYMSCHRSSGITKKMSPDQVTATIQWICSNTSLPQRFNPRGIRPTHTGFVMFYDDVSPPLFAHVPIHSVSETDKCVYVDEIDKELGASGRITGNITELQSADGWKIGANQNRLAFVINAHTIDSFYVLYVPGIGSKTRKLYPDPGAWSGNEDEVAAASAKIKQTPWPSKVVALSKETKKTLAATKKKEKEEKKEASEARREKAKNTRAKKRTK